MRNNQNCNDSTPTKHQNLLRLEAPMGRSAAMSQETGSTGKEGIAAAHQTRLRLLCSRTLSSTRLPPARHTVVCIHTYMHTYIYICTYIHTYIHTQRIKLLRLRLGRVSTSLLLMCCDALENQLTGFAWPSL